MVQDNPAPLVGVTDLTKVYDLRGGHLYAVDGVSLSIAPGEAVAVVGESGSGKSTIARCLLRLEMVTAGQILFKGQDITRMPERQFRPLRRHAQMVFQDPLLSLNPRLTVRQTVTEPLRLHHIVPGSGMEARLQEILAMVNLDAHLATRKPRELSGGQRQRVAIARAIATFPSLVVLDEPTSSLDMSIRMQVIELLRRLKQDLGMAYLFITHDLSTVQYLCSRTIVMYLGRIMEEGPSSEVFTHPKHPYTQALISSIPIADPGRKKTRVMLPGERPNVLARIVGCPLAGRCPYVMPACTRGEIPMYDVGIGSPHRVACLLYRSDESPAPDREASFASASRWERPVPE